MKQALGLPLAAALLAVCIYFLLSPHGNLPAFHYASKLSKESRLPFHSRFIDAVGQRVLVSVHVKNPSAAFFSLCVVKPGAKLPQCVTPFPQRPPGTLFLCNIQRRYVRKRACGGLFASQMRTADHDVDQRNLILDDRDVALEWSSEPAARGDVGNYTIVWENHNSVYAAEFDAVVNIALHSDVSSLVGDFLSYPISALRACFTSIANAYSFIRPASCRSSAKTSWNKALASECASILKTIDKSLLPVCDALSSGHTALVLIVLLNALCFMPSISDQRWWALNSSRLRLRTLFTYQFAHADVQHIAGNMLTLLFVGSEVSESLNCDHIIFMGLYLLCGLAGGLFAVWFSPARVKTVGASGSVSGVIVALSVMRPNSAVAILGDVNASHPLMLLTGTLLADLQRLGVSWQVLCRPSLPICSCLIDSRVSVISAAASRAMC